MAFNKDCKLLTDGGYISTSSLLNETVNLVLPDKKIVLSRVFAVDETTAIKLAFDNGEYIICNPNQKFILKDGIEEFGLYMKNKSIINIDGDSVSCTDIQTDISDHLYTFDSGIYNYCIGNGFIIHN